MKQIFPLEISVVYMVVQQLIFKGLLAEVVKLSFAYHFLKRGVDTGILIDAFHHLVQRREVFRVQGELRVHVSSELHRLC